MVFCYRILDMLHYIKIIVQWAFNKMDISYLRNKNSSNLVCAKNLKQYNKFILVVPVN